MHMRRAVKIADMLSGVDRIPTDKQTGERTGVYTDIYKHAAERQMDI